jgi:hypothetical protein
MGLDYRELGKLIRLSLVDSEQEGIGVFEQEVKGK